MDCSSPISTSSISKSGKVERGPAGTGSPQSAINDSIPAVLRAMVLPPALGPVITITESVPLLPPSCSASGSTRGSIPRFCIISSSGWRASTSRSSPSSFSVAGSSSNSSAKLAMLLRVSSTSKVSKQAASSGASSRIQLESWRRILISSAFSSAARFSSSLTKGIISSGSMNAVSPEEETSCTTPLTMPLESIRTGITQRPERWVMKSSCRKISMPLSRMISSIFLRMRLAKARLARRVSLRKVEAESMMLPSWSMEAVSGSRISGKPFSCGSSVFNSGMSSRGENCRAMAAKISSTGMNVSSS